MALLGLLTGVSYQSGIDYYQSINEQYMALEHPNSHVMPPNPDLVMVSVDCDAYAHHLINKDWSGVADYLLERGVKRIVGAGATCLCICSNTAHIAVPRIRKQYPSLDILHIADTTAKAILSAGMTRVGLLGTEPTMREDYLKVALRAHGIETVVPDDEDQHKIFSYIMHELGFGKFDQQTREYFKQQVRSLVSDKGATGVILGCTEIELLLSQKDTPEIPLFASAALHIAAAVQVASGMKQASDYAPAGENIDRKEMTMEHRDHSKLIPQFSAADVHRLLPVSTSIKAATTALTSLSDGSGVMPVRSVMKLPIEKFGVLANMPSFLGEHCATKTITVFPSNASDPQLSSHQGAIQLFSVDDGHQLCIADAHAITLLRTAAASAVATKALARNPEGGSVLALLGTGDQCLAHFNAIREVRKIKRVHIWGRNSVKAEAAAKRVRDSTVDLEMEVIVSESVEEAVAKADIVCTLTGAKDPILKGEWLRQGTHINAVGACTPAHRELDTNVLQRSKVYVDTMAACIKEPGDLVQPLESGEIERSHFLGEIGSLLKGEIENPRGEEDVSTITLFKSVGIALEDLTATVAVFEAAKKEKEE